METADRSWLRAFRVMVWAVICFIPVRASAGSAIVEIPPDALGWLLFIVALRMVDGSQRVTKRLRSLAVVGLVLSVPRIVAPAEASMAVRSAYLVLYGAGAAAAAGFVWRVCNLIAEAAERGGDLRLRTYAERMRLVYLTNAFLLPLAVAYAWGTEPPVAHSLRALLQILVLQTALLPLPCLIVALLAILMLRTARMRTASAATATAVDSEIRPGTGG